MEGWRQITPDSEAYGHLPESERAVAALADFNRDFAEGKRDKYQVSLLGKPIHPGLLETAKELSAQPDGLYRNSIMDATMDAQGRVLVGFADGCTGACATNPANTAKSVWATIARQSNGLGLFSAFDPKGLTEQNVNSLIALQVTNPASASGISSFNLAIKDTSTQAIFTPLRAEVGQISSASGRVTVANADNAQTGAGANWSYSSQVGGDNVLYSAEVSSARSLKFRNSNNESFTVTFNVIGNLPYTGPSCCSPTSASSSGGGSGANSPTSSSPSISSATNLVYQITYNPVVNTITVRLLGSP